MKLPDLIKSKIYKTGQTRGADDDVIYQNRVSRNSTVLIPFSSYDQCLNATVINGIFENGYIVLINPKNYFDSEEFRLNMKLKNIIIGENALLFYETREQWSSYNPEKEKLQVATSRILPLNGHFVARIPSTTSLKDSKINIGFNTSSLKGAGIRVYEYASKEVIKKCNYQLEYLYWNCFDSKEVSIAAGMTEIEVMDMIEKSKEVTKKLGLSDHDRLFEMRIIDCDSNTVCPLCLEKLSAKGFYSKIEQAEGRHVPDLTVTQLNLFHIKELRVGEFNHKPYNLGWGHHHCNTVTKDSGITETLRWMSSVVEKNIRNGYKI